jgi:hypothetical protein
MSSRSRYTGPFALSTPGEPRFRDERRPPHAPLYNNHPFNIQVWWMLYDERKTRREKGSNPTPLELAAWAWELHYKWLNEKCISPAVLHKIAVDVAAPP